MWRAFLLLPPLICPGQITKPPEFEQPQIFRTSPTQSGLDGTSHVAAQQRRLSASLLTQLSKLDVTGLSTEQHKRFDGGRDLLTRGLVSAAVEHFRAAAERYGECVPIRLGYAVSLYLASKPESSAAEVLSIKEDNPAVAEFLGEIAPSAPGHVKDIENRLRQIAAAHPQNGEVRYYLAAVLNADGTSKESEDLWKQAAELNRTDPRPCIELARVAPNPESAILWLQKALQRDRNLAEAHYRLARLYLQTGNRAESERHLEQFRELKKSRAQ